MPKRSDTPGVTIVTGATITSPLQIIFKHPLLDGKQVKRSTGTADGVLAKDLARKLSQIVNSPDCWSKLPSETPEVLRSMWEQDPLAETVKEYAEQPSWPYDMTPGAASESKYQLQKLAKKLHARNRDLEVRNAALEAKLASASALLRKLGHAAATEYTPKPLKQAVEDYLSDDKKLSGTSGKARHKKQLGAWLLRFCRIVGDSMPVHDISPALVIDHLANVEAGKFVTARAPKKPKHETVRRIGEKICAMLEHQTAGLFRDDPVKDWTRKQLTTDDRKSIYWLDQADVDMLVREMRRLYPEPWSWLVELQWAGGFRPEELMALQTRNVLRKKDEEARVSVDDIVDGATTYWKPKTKRSYGKVHIPDFGVKALDQLAARKTFLLFPNDATFHGGKTPRWDMKITKDGAAGMARYSEFQRNHGLWEPEAFTEQYLSRLRAAARAAGLDEKRLDSRTLRRSCGKRVLLASNYNLELTAAILRDLPNTVREHYADLLPEDVRQPE